MYFAGSFMVKMNTTQTARANKTYAHAGSIVTTALGSLRTILSLNAVDRTIHQYQEATKEAYDGAVSQFWLVGLANGLVMCSYLIRYESGLNDDQSTKTRR